MNEDPVYLSLSEAAAWVGRTPRTIQRWVAEEAISSIVEDGRRQVTLDEVVEVERTRRLRTAAYEDRVQSLLADLT